MEKQLPAVLEESTMCIPAVMFDCLRRYSQQVLDNSFHRVRGARAILVSWARSRCDAFFAPPVWEVHRVPARPNSTHQHTCSQPAQKEKTNPRDLRPRDSSCIVASGATASSRGSPVRRRTRTWSAAGCQGCVGFRGLLFCRV